jgi:serine/threonine protein kinase
MQTPPRIGRYELLEQIDQGSLGALYRGRDTVLGREVAIKVMAAGFQGEDSAKARFFREARAAARLQHVNIVTIFEFGEHDETPFIVMEFLRGCSLAERLRDGPAQSLRDKLDVAIQLCAGLEAAHTQGVVHRDVRPENIWLCHDGTVKLVDFGIATAASASATFVDVLASPGYMSPERIAGSTVDGRTDVFSVGVVLYEMLTGRRPFEADSPTGVMLKIVNDTATPIVDRELPQALTAAVMRAIEKSPDTRYARASELGRDLKAVKADLPMPVDSGTHFIDATLLHARAERTVTTEVPSLAKAPTGTWSDRLREMLSQWRDWLDEMLPLWSARLREMLAQSRERLGEMLPQWQERLQQMPMQLLWGAAGLLVLLVLVVWLAWPDGDAPPAASSGTTAPRSDSPRAAPAPTTPPPPAPVDPAAGSYAVLRVTSRPVAARILFDGADTGKTTPAEIQVETGKAPTLIQLELPGFQTEVVSLTPELLRGGAVDVALAPRTPAPEVRLLATGEYRFDVMNRQRLLSPDSDRHDVVVSGLRTVQLRSDRYFLNQTVRVDRTDAGTVSAVAAPLGSISIYAVGPLEDCKVFIDEQIVDAGSFPVANRPIASGTHNVKLRCVAGDTDGRVVTVPPYQSVSTRFPANTYLRPR